MKINYVENNNGKLFSFFRHDYKDDTDEQGNFIMIDGGFDYIRYSGELKESKIKNIISDVRNQFEWGNNYDKNDKLLPKTVYVLLKNLDTKHILNILSYFNNKAFNDIIKKEKDDFKIERNIIDKRWLVIHEIFTQELIHRYEQRIS